MSGTYFGMLSSNTSAIGPLVSLPHLLVHGYLGHGESCDENNILSLSNWMKERRMMYITFVSLETELRLLPQLRLLPLFH